jgi:hypothetical protein
MENNKEVFEGYVLDLACIRKYPQDELLERGKAHTRNCALMGHCIESGYGLVNENGDVRVLDAKATPLVIEKVGGGSREKGIKLRAFREKNEKEMETTAIEEV